MPDDLPIDDPPRQFPDWMRRLDPRLAAEDTNALFRAFLVSRTTYRRQFILGRRVLRSMAILLLAVALLCLMGQILPHLNRFQILVLFGLIIFGPSIYRALRPAKDARFRMPPTIARLFPEKEIPKQAVRDLWMSGLGGRDVVEALYLEQRAGQLAGALWGLPILPLAGMAMLFGSCISLCHPLGADVAVAFVGVAAAMAALVLAIESAGRVLSLDRILHTLDHWSSRTNPQVPYIQRRGAIQKIVVGLFFCGLIAAWIVSVAGWTDQLYTSFAGGKTHIGGVSVYLLVGAAMFLLAVAAVLVRFMLIRMAQVKETEAHLRAPFLFEAWVSTIVLDDPGGYAAAVERFGRDDFTRHSEWRRGLSLWDTLLVDL